MPATLELDTETAPDAEKLSALEEQIKADEQDFAAQRAAKARDDGRNLPTQRGSNGKFVSAKEGQRAAPAADPLDKETVTGTAVKLTETGAAAGAASAPTDTTKAKEGTAAAAPAEEDESKLSPFERAKRREAKAWKQINADKLAAEARDAALRARELRLEARERETQTARPAQYSPEDYLRAAADFEAKAAKLEASGDFEAADEERVLAKAARKMAAAEPAPAAARGTPGRALAPAEHDQALGRNWDTLKAEMPELLDPNGPFNKETIALLKDNPALLNDPAGPYRAVVQVGRKVVKSLEAEAAKVPDLQKSVETLQKRVKELEALTSLPGGGGPTSRGAGGGEVDFASLPADKRENLLREELAGLRG